MYEWLQGGVFCSHSIDTCLIDEEYTMFLDDKECHTINLSTMIAITEI